MKDGLSRAVVGAAAAMTLLTAAGLPLFGSIIAFGETTPLVQLPWVLPVAQAFVILSSLAVAWLSLGRYLSLGGSWVLWSGAVFVASGVLGTFYLLSWPGLIGTTGLIGQRSNTASWFFFMTFTCLAMLLGTINAPVEAKAGSRRRAYTIYILAAGLAFLVGLLSLSFESALPLLVTGLDFTPLNIAWVFALAVALALGAFLAHRRYLREGDVMLGYMALFLVLMAFGLGYSILGGKRYDAWWYAARAVYDLAYLSILFGLLQEGYALFGRERARAEERAELLKAERQARSEAEAARRRADGILESIGDAFFAVDRGWRFTYVNADAERLLRRKRSDLIGKGLWEEFPEAVGSTFWGEYHRAVVEGKTATFEEFYPPLGAWFDVRAYPSPEGLSVYFRDVTARRKADEEYRRASALLRVINEATPTLIYMKDLECRMVMANPAVLEMLGKKEQEVIGHTDFDHLPHHIAEPIHADDRKVMHEGITSTFEEVTETHQGKRFWLSAKTPYRAENGDVIGLIGVSVDITAQKEAEAEREWLLAKEKEARSLAEKAVRIREEFISIAAHELKTPVTALQGFSQVISKQIAKSGAVDTSRLSRAMDSISQQSKRLTKLTEQLLNLSRLDAGKLTLTREEIDLAALVEGVIATVRHSHPERTIELQQDGAVPALVDPLRLEQVFINLLDNALKFSPATRPVVVKIETDEGTRWVHVAVRDYGRGVAEDQVEKVFERFHQAHEERHYGGMGIGLYVSRQFVQMHGGEITVERPDGGGSSFVVHLPLDGTDDTPAGVIPHE